MLVALRERAMREEEKGEGEGKWRKRGKGRKCRIEEGDREWRGWGG